jgi:hypothetical protein
MLVMQNVGRAEGGANLKFSDVVVEENDELSVSNKGWDGNI